MTQLFAALMLIALVALGMVMALCLWVFACLTWAGHWLRLERVDGRDRRRALCDPGAG